MSERNRGDEERGAPAQQAQQPQPSKTLNDHVQSPHLLAEKTGRISESSGRGRPARSCDDTGGELNDTTPNGRAAFDEARFNAGVVKLYETLLKEAIPEEMLRLVDQLGKQERK